MTTIRKFVGLMLALSIALVGIGMAAVPYNSDWQGKNAPFISGIDPTGGKVTVTNPGADLTGNLKFIDVFGRTIKNEGNVTLVTGENTFSVAIRDHGNIGIHTDYYILPTEQEVMLGALGKHNNDDLAMASIVAYLSASRMGGVYQKGSNGVWGWVKN